MMLKKLQTIFKALIIYSILLSSSTAEILKPSSNIKPSEVVKIQLNGLQKNDLDFKDSGIEQTWNFAHPNNKKVTGPLPNFKRMIKGDAYQMMLDHISHTITELGSSNNWAQFEVIILDKNKIYHKFNWQVEKYTLDGLLKDCWLTTMVSNPIPLGSSI
ncbi:hypothetical protein OAM30_01130 [Candidatus Pelagibacter sp.]|uniref:hypothetical protein n=1 Tax=uncultured Candidatus Pelagibacter sp. TaxID=372654 RepID=UPI002337CD01|nr:hypothetical protein [uncultured Candidatus Pelagibacter sp.]MDB3947011.1 hypothetical protein [Candidatus Pelagibacter sp.]MDC0405154.1 hypothetical protein [Candidatus Pelagibacter sp.]MDC0428537.1 hypothetical protein [Candidatus Pelagibacter sp.]MDC0465491.1 hypothetical protein [Candidatus Pelagibacter sp.]